MSLTNAHKSAIFLSLGFAIFSLARGGLILAYPEIFRSLDTSQVVSAFARGLQFDAAALMTLCGLPLLLFNVPFSFTRRPWWQRLSGWTFTLSLLLASLLLAGDIVYFPYVQRHVGYELVLLKNDAGVLLQTALRSYPVALAAFFTYAAALAWLGKKLISLPVKPGPRGTAVAGFVLTIALVILGNRGGFSRKSLHVIDAFAHGNYLQGNLVLNGVFTALQFTRKAPAAADYSFFTQEELGNLTGADLARKYPLLARLSPGKKTGHNLVLIILESWGAHFIDSFSPAKLGITKNFDGLARDGVTCPRFYAAGRWSLYGIQAILTGFPVLPGIPTLGNGLEVSSISKVAEIAKKNGYRTLFVQSSRRRSFRLDSVARAIGFEEIYGMEDIPLLFPYPKGSSPKFGWDYDTLMFLLGKLGESGDGPPFFAAVFTGTTHLPYVKIDPRFEVFPYTDKGREGFLNTLKYADWSLGEFFRKARSQPWFDRTIFILTADHSFEGKNFDEQFRIPLVIYAPGILPPRALAGVGSQLDVMPTIIDLLGFPDEFTALGESLFRKREDWALVFDNEFPAIVASGGYLRHNLKTRLEAVAFNGTTDNAEFAEMEKKLLAMTQLAYQLITSNRWAQ